jgi:hypothetical protein
MREYGERPVYAEAVKRAMAVIEASYEAQLRTATPTGAIFALKQVGWSDRQDLTLSGGLAAIDYSRLTDDQLVRMAKGEHPLSVLASAPARAAVARPAVPEARRLRAGPADGSG